MGKSKIVQIPIQNRQLNIYENYKKNHSNTFDLFENERNQDRPLSENMQIFRHQVAGHMADENSIGMINHNGAILKPITNRKCFEREVEFYENFEKTKDIELLQLKQFIPKYFGKVKIPIKGKNYDCIILEDLTRHFKEPCIMDVKIGKRTWDPEATYEKIIKEEAKYQDCKRDLSFCIPGFQVYDINNNQLCKFGKDFGKQLDKDSIRKALRRFLNGEQVLCRRLIVQFLTNLWRIQHWMRNQRQINLYSSSILLIYDARRLREIMKQLPTEKLITDQVKLNRTTSLYRPLSLAILNEKISTGFSGQLTKEGPILKSINPIKVKNLDIIPENCNNVWKQSIHTLKRTHSFQNNYDKDLQSRKLDYTYILDDLVADEQKSELWVVVKMIDFAHVFPAKQSDRNYLDGINKLVAVFEEFLMESEEF